MAMIITHNISAINTQRNLSITNRHLGKSLEKLSSGYRINTGADGPADLIISEQLRAQNVGLERAVRNTQEAINVLGIAEGALTEMNEILKKMRALALHAANNGITSGQQVAADQSEVDSGIQTIDRIANTTKYSNTFLLNGAKQIVFDQDTLTKGTQQNSLLNLGQSRLDQIFKRNDFNIAINFSGASSTPAEMSVLRGDGVANVEKEARKAYFEINPQNGGNDVDPTGVLTAAQQFILTGTKGSRSFSFDVGATMGQIAAAIGNVADSTGVDATLIFNDRQLHNMATTSATLGNGFNVTGTATTSGFSAGQAVIFNNDRNQGIAAFGGTIATDLNGTGGTAAGAVVGFNTDGQGRIWVKWTTDTIYKL